MMWSSVERFLKAEDGLISAIFVITLPLLIFAAGIAIDMSSIEAEKRYVQAQADLGALTAIRHYDAAATMRVAARKTITANYRYPTLPTPDSHIEIGIAGRGTFLRATDQQVIGNNTAVRVTVQARPVLYILPMFLNDDDLMITRVAVAAQQPRVSFALSNCRLNADLLRPILAPLIGAQVDVLCSGHGIDSRISGQGFLNSLQAEASLMIPSGSDMTYGDILNANLPVASVLGAALGTPVIGGTQAIRLADFIYLGPDLRNIRVGQPLPSLYLNAADIAFASAELLGKRVANIRAAVTLPSIGTVQAKVIIGEPRQIVLGAIPGDPMAIARTGQMRIELPAVRIGTVFNLTMGLDLANASAKLTAEGATCSRDARTVVAVFDPVKASLLDLDLQIDVLGLPLNLSAVGHVSDAIVTRVQQRVTYTRLQATVAPVRTFGPQLAVDIDALTSTISGTISAMLSTASVAITNNRGPTCKNPLDCLLNATLQTVKQVVNTVLTNVTKAATNVTNATGLEGIMTKSILKDLLGLKVAEAQLDLLEAGCIGNPRLVQ